MSFALDGPNIRKKQDTNQETKPSIKKPNKPGKKLCANTNIKSNRSGGKENVQEVLDDLSRISAGAKQQLM